MVILNLSFILLDLKIIKNFDLSANEKSGETGKLLFVKSIRALAVSKCIIWVV